MYYLITNLPPMEQNNIVFFNTIRVLIEGNVNVKGSRFIGNNKKEKINKMSSNLKYIKSHINLVNEVYTLKRDSKGWYYYEHNKTLEKIYTYHFVKLENNTILKFQTGENLEEYIIALENEYIPQASSPPKSMLRYLSLYPNLNNNTLSSFNHIKLLIETSNNKEATTLNIIKMIQNKQGKALRNMVLKKLDKWSMESPDFPGYMIEVIRTEKKPTNIKKIEKYINKKNILDKLDKLERGEATTSTTVSSTKPLEAEAVSIPDTGEDLYDATDDNSTPSQKIDFKKQYYILKDQNKKLEENYEQIEGNYEELIHENDSLENDLHNSRQQLKKNRGKLESFRVMEDFDQNHDGIISRPELENIFTGNAQKKGGGLDKYYKLL